MPTHLTASPLSVNSLLDELRTTFVKADTMAPRVPPKLQHYIEEFYSLDVLRMQKAQLARIKIDEPPFLSEDVFGIPPASKATPVQPKSVGRSRADSEDEEYSEGTTSDSGQSSSSDEASSRNGALARRTSTSTLRRSEAVGGCAKHPKRTPHLDKVANALGEADAALAAAQKEVKSIRLEQEETRERILSLASKASQSLENMNGELFQQVSVKYACARPQIVF